MGIFFRRNGYSRRDPAGQQTEADSEGSRYAQEIGPGGLIPFQFNNQTRRLRRMRLAFTLIL